jgi:succinoglycan biosynthesis protein ExoA
MTWRPVVTVVVPMLDELESIEACLDGFEQQTYPLDLVDVVVVDGGSTDGSRELVEERSARTPWLRLIDNPDRRASVAFNRGMEAAKGDVVCLFSAHGVPESEYLDRSVAVLDETGAAGVGGRYDHVGTDPVSTAIGLAMASPFGMASPHRFAAERAEVDTISHPAYRRDAMLSVGGFDASLLRNSDYEFNHRMRRAGQRLVFDPSIGSIYRPRPSLQALGRQFWWYGRWKARVVRLHPGSRKLRHLAPPAAVALGVAAPALALGRRGRRLVVLAATGYATLGVAALRRERPRIHGADPATFLAAFPVMHGAWGAGYLASLLEDRFGRRTP